MARYAEVNIVPGPPGEPPIDTVEGIRDIPYNFPLEMNEAPRHELAQADLFIEGEFEIPYEVDPAQPMNTIHITDTSVSKDVFGNKYKTGSKRWGTDVADSLMVFERSSSDFTAGVINITTANGSTSIIQGRQKGRKSVLRPSELLLVKPKERSSNTPELNLMPETQSQSIQKLLYGPESSVGTPPAYAST